MIQSPIAVLIGRQIKRMPMPRQGPPVRILAGKRGRPIPLGIRRNVPPIPLPLADLGVESHGLGTGTLGQGKSVFDERQDGPIEGVAGDRETAGLYRHMAKGSRFWGEAV